MNITRRVRRFKPRDRRKATGRRGVMGLLTAQTACEINGNELGRELGIDRKTAVRWLEIAEATYNGAEVDVVLEWNGTIFPVEIKTTSRPGSRDGLGIRSFRSAFPKERVAPGLLICSVEQPAWVTPELFAVPWWAL